MLALRVRKKTLYILGLTFTSLIIIQYAASQLIFLKSFSTLEDQDTTQNVNRVINAINSDLNNLDAFVYDWAAWDDTYAFIQDVNEQYIESNLVVETFIGSELNLMMFVNLSGEVVYSKAFDLENEEEIAVPESIQEQLALNKTLLQHNDTESTLKGILLLPEGPMIIVSRPIITSNDKGPILGSLIMGYYLDSARLEKLAETTQLSLNIQQINVSQLPTDFQEASSSLSEKTPIVIKPLTENLIAGYTLVDDVYGEPCLIIKVDLPRSIYQQGNSSVSYFVLLLLTTGITFSIVIMLFLEKTVLSRLAQLNTNIKEIRSQRRISNRVSVKGKDDEIIDLANEINGMLESVEQSQDKLQIANEKLSVVGKLTRHDIRNKLSVIANNVYLAKKNLEGNSKAIQHLDSIDLSIDQMEKILDFSKTYETMGIEEPSYIDAKALVQETVMSLGLSNITFVNNLDNLTLLSDSLLRQLFFNLIDDTLKHAKKAKQIQVYYQAEESELKLVYEDDGIGIADSEKELIFKEGYGKGTGYGLYMIRKICEAYGWAIKETGKQGKGAQFIITIPKMNKNGKENYYIK